MSRIGVVSALPLEARCLTGRRYSRRRIVLSTAAMLGISGPGPVCAQRMAEQLVAQGATELVSWGLAGGLDPSIATGTLVVPDHVVDANDVNYSTDRAWRQRILAALPPQVSVVEAPLFASEHIAATVEDKVTLRRRYTAVAIDMESAGIARAASRYGLPLLVLRVVVDPAGVVLPPPLAGVVSAGGAVRLRYLINILARRPYLLWPLLELAWRARIATSTLRRTAPMITGDDALYLVAPAANP